MTYAYSGWACAWNQLRCMCAYVHQKKMGVVMTLILRKYNERPIRCALLPDEHAYVRLLVRKY